MEGRMPSYTGSPKPFIKWVGGKTGLLPCLDGLLPSDLGKWNDATYVEPFVGGGAMLFHILSNYPNIRHALINDVNPQLAACYRTIRDQPEKLKQALHDIEGHYLPLSYDQRKSYYLDRRAEFNAGIADEICQTAVFIFLNRTCFNGLYRVNRRGEFNVPFGRYANPKICDEPTIDADSRLLQRVEITTGDFENLTIGPDARAFYYFDPPYRPISTTSAFTSYADGGFGDSDQCRLKSFCDRISAGGHLLMLSNSDSRMSDNDPDFFDRLYKDYTIHRTSAARAINSNGAKRGKVSEIVVCNYSQQ